MDKIQEVLVKVGRKDLAQEYYLKVAANKFKVPSHLTKIKYVILGGDSPSENHYKIAKIIRFGLSEDTIERLKSGDLKEEAIYYEDLLYTVQIEGKPNPVVVSNKEIDHAIEFLPR